MEYKPNIFNYATSELSQDAVICYFAEWANTKYQDGSMYKVGQKFVKSLLAKFDIYTDITEVKVYRQYQKIDVLLAVNNQYAIIIEDKTTSSEHSNQLQRYKEFVKNDKKFEGLKELGIYFKTANQSSLSAIQNSQFKPYLRSDILNFINELDTEDTIFNNFAQNIKKYDKDLASWHDLPIGQWTWNSWDGFFNDFKTTFDVPLTWRIVNAPSHSFLGGVIDGWDNRIMWNEYSVFIHVESDTGRLAFKMCDETVQMTNEHQIKRRTELYNKIISLSKELNLDVCKPPRFRQGKSMTFAIVKRQNYLGADDSIIDCTKVKEKILQYRNLLIKCISK